MLATSEKKGNKPVAELLKEFELPKVVFRSPEEIEERRQLYHEAVVSFALEGDEPDDFGKVASMEKIRGEIRPEDFQAIIGEQVPEETARINAKIARLHELGLSWKDL